MATEKPLSKVLRQRAREYETKYGVEMAASLLGVSGDVVRSLLSRGAA